MSMNPFDEIAVEEAVRLKESGIASEVIVLTIGVEKSEEVLRTAMAIGADRGIHVILQNDIQPLAVAKIIAKYAASESPQIILLGKQAIDDDSNQAGQMLAGILGWGQGTFASKIEMNDDSVNVTREVDGGLSTIKLKLPAVITTDLRLNEPRYVALPNIMKARSKPIEKINIDELEVDIASRIEVLKIEEPEKRSGGIIVDNVAELVDKLKNEAKVI